MSAREFVDKQRRETGAAGGYTVGGRTVSEEEVDNLAKELWDADFHPAMVDDREWPEVQGLMRMIYRGKAAHQLLIGRPAS